jgi:DAACS family dicarboxylate/amino acid:cation (Na+ or H+) symporter
VSSHGRIFAALIVGIAVGAIAKIPGTGGLQSALALAEPLGTIFIRLITMVVIPLVVAGLVVGVSSLGDLRKLGRIGGKTLAYFAVTMTLAAAIGIGVALAAGIGQGLDDASRENLLGQFTERGARAAADVAAVPGLIDQLVAMTPQNIFASAAEGDLLPLIIAVLLFSAAATVVSGEGRRTVIAFFEGVNQLSMTVIGWLMVLAPAAVFILIAGTVARLGLDVLRSLLFYALVVVAALALHVGTTLVIALRFGAGLGPIAFVRAVSDALLLAFSTASSNVTLPVSIKAATRRVGVSAAIANFILPAGTTLNKNGAAVYKAVTAVYIAQLYGLDLTAGHLLTIVFTTVLASSAGAGVPGSSLVTTLIVLNAIGLGPYAAAGIALVVGIDRPLDMCRTAVNTAANLVGAAVVARSEGEPISVGAAD